MRYERKYRIEGLSPKMIEQTICLHPAGFRPYYTNRQINNIYFDTPNLQTYQENVMGIAVRNKYRVRWYGAEMQEITEPRLEIKHRDNEVGGKTTLSLAPFFLSDLAPVTTEINNRLKMGMLQPMLLNSYQRAYFVTANEHFRITIDWQLRYHPILQQPHFQRYSLVEPNICILELKYEEGMDDRADSIMQALPFLRSKNSKYVNGINLCYNIR